MVFKRNQQSDLSYRHRLPLHLNPQPFAVGDELYGAVLVGAVDVLPADFFFQPRQYLIVGVPERVVGAHRYHRDGWVNGDQKSRAGGRTGAVVADLGD